MLSIALPPTRQDEVLKLIGNRVMLARMEDSLVSQGGVWLPDRKETGVIHRCIGVGPGEWILCGKEGKRKWKFIQPEIAWGEMCVSYHFFRSSETPKWHQPVYLDHADGRGRVILDARFVELTWTPGAEPKQEPQLTIVK